VVHFRRFVVEMQASTSKLQFAVKSRRGLERWVKLEGTH
jgi:hypothetical protein